MTIKEPEVKLRALRNGDCFMFNRQAYIVKKTFWENLGMLKRKVYVCRMKFNDYDTHFLPDEDVYRISRGLYDILVQAENNKEIEL